MLKVMEFVLLGALILVVAGLIFAGPRFAPPAEDEVPLGAAKSHSSDEKNGGSPTAS